MESTDVRTLEEFLSRGDSTKSKGITVSQSHYADDTAAMIAIEEERKQREKAQELRNRAILPVRPIQNSQYLLPVEGDTLNCKSLIFSSKSSLGLPPVSFAMA
jgi:hypothetical protein